MSKIPRHRGASGVELMKAKARHRAMDVARDKLGVMNSHRSRSGVDIVSSGAGADIISVKKKGVSGFTALALSTDAGGGQEHASPSLLLFKPTAKGVRIDSSGRTGGGGSRDWKGFYRGNKPKFTLTYGPGLWVLQNGLLLVYAPQKYVFDRVVSASILRQELEDGSRKLWLVVIVTRETYPVPGAFGPGAGTSIQVAPYLKPRSSDVPVMNAIDFIEIGAVASTSAARHSFCHFNPTGTEAQLFAGSRRFQINIDASVSKEPTTGWMTAIEYPTNFAPVIPSSPSYLGNTEAPYPEGDAIYEGESTQQGYMIVAGGYTKEGALVLAKVHLDVKGSGVLHAADGISHYVSTNGDLSAYLSFVEEGVSTSPTLLLALRNYSQIEDNPGDYILTDSVSGRMTSVRALDVRIKAVLYESWGGDNPGVMRLWVDGEQVLPEEGSGEIAAVGGLWHNLYGSNVGFNRHLMFDRNALGILFLAHSVGAPAPPLHYQLYPRLTIFHSEQSSVEGRAPFNYLTGADPVALVNAEVDRINEKHSGDTDWTPRLNMNNNPRFHNISVI